MKRGEKKRDPGSVSRVSFFCCFFFPRFFLFLVLFGTSSNFLPPKKEEQIMFPSRISRLSPLFRCYSTQNPDAFVNVQVDRALTAKEISGIFRKVGDLNWVSPLINAETLQFSGDWTLRFQSPPNPLSSSWKSIFRLSQKTDVTSLKHLVQNETLDARFLRGTRFRLVTTATEEEVKRDFPREARFHVQFVKQIEDEKNIFFLRYDDTEYQIIMGQFPHIQSLNPKHIFLQRIPNSHVIKNWKDQKEESEK